MCVYGCVCMCLHVFVRQLWFVIAASNVSQSDWGLIGTWDFDFTLSEFNVEKYANGVQDMPTDLKKNLREGGFFYVCDETNVKGVKCRWQASPELQYISTIFHRTCVHPTVCASSTTLACLPALKCASLAVDWCGMKVMRFPCLGPIRCLCHVFLSFTKVRDQNSSNRSLASISLP